MKILIIQTAFLGDVVLATPLIEKLHRTYPEANIDFLLRKGNEALLKGHPLLRDVLIWDKKKNKLGGLFRLWRHIRAEGYDVVVTCHRFASSGLLTAFSGAADTVGFVKNPLSFLFKRRLPHVFGPDIHEVDRNISLTAHLCGSERERPRLYPSEADYARANAIAGPQEYCCIAPTSVWFTKQLEPGKWMELIGRIPETCKVYLLGAPGDAVACAAIAEGSGRGGVVNLAGQLALLESAALMAGARMNYVNDSAPMHMASAMNAPTTAVFCSTIPDFGFGPLSDNRFLVETTVFLKCRPCGLHGFKNCPQGHFDCSNTISVAHFPMP